MDKKEIILVTGPSGVHIKDSLKRLNNSISEENIISIEKKIEDISKMPFREFIGALQYKQYRFWSKAFEEIVKNDIPQKAPVEPLFLTFHAIYYHQQKREFFSPINMNKLRKLKKLRKIKMLIVFIDDVYDVYRRLMDKGEMYEDVLKKDKIPPLKAIFSSIFNIISLLNWREIEIAFSRFIAKFLDNIPIFIISTKHPSFMINRLIEKPLSEIKFYYLSHPITTIRQESQTQLPAFVGSLESVIRTIIDDENRVLFFPTSIDELIIKREKISEGKYFYWPVLAQRWAPPYPEKLLSPPLPSDLSSIPPLNPQNYKVSPRKNNLTTSAISQMLSLLWDFIYLKQVISRDYSLVEETENGIIVCRPFLRGIKSYGVMGETEYNLRLMNEQKRRPKPKRKCFVFSCKEDLNKWSIYSFFEQLERSLKESCLKRIRKDLDDLRNRWLTTSNKVIKKDSESLRKEVEKRIPGLDFEYGESSPWKFDDMTGEINKRKFIFSQSWEKAKKDPIKIMINEIIETEKIKKNVYYKFYNEDSFWKKVNQFIKQNIKKEV